MKKREILTKRNSVCQHRLSNELCLEMMRTSMGLEHTLLRETHRPHADACGWQSRTKPRWLRVHWSGGVSRLPDSYRISKAQNL